MENVVAAKCFLRNPSESRVLGKSVVEFSWVWGGAGEIPLIRC